jgi:AraC-like DNA-binding protein
MDSDLHLKTKAEWQTLAAKANYHASKLAFLCRVSLKTLERYFQESTHTTPGKWLREQRCTRAVALLVEGKHSHKEIAHLLGFRNVTQFYRELQSQLGVSPNDFAAHYNKKFIFVQSLGTKNCKRLVTSFGTNVEICQ